MGRYNISLNDNLIKQIDTVAKAAYMGRSDFIREAVIEHLRTLQQIQNIHDIQPLTDEQLTDSLRKLQKEMGKRGLYRDPETRAYIRGAQRQPRRTLYRGHDI